MNIDKAELQKMLLNNMGADVEDRKDAAQKELNQYEGGISALRTAKTNIEQLHEHLKLDVREGRISGLIDPVDVEKEVHKWINRAADIVENLALGSETRKLQTMGRVMALDDMVLIHSKKIEEIDRKLANYKKYLESASENSEVSENSGIPRKRPDGVHPGNPIAERKKKSTKRKSSRKKTEKTTES